MAKQKVVVFSARCDQEFNKKIDRAIKDGGFSSPSAFIRNAVEPELAGRVSGLQEAEDRIAASLDRMAGEIRSVRFGQQALFAFCGRIGQDSPHLSGGAAAGCVQSGRRARQPSL